MLASFSAALLGALVSPPATAQTGGDGCTAAGGTLGEAVAAYATTCAPLPRRDCDPVGGRWVCSSARIGANAPGITGSPAAAPVVATPEPAPAPTASPFEPASADPACSATGNSLGAARTSYAQRCSAPRVDCDPTGGRWICASYRIGPGTSGQLSSPTTAGRAPAPSPSAATSSPTVTPPTSVSLVAEAESAAIGGLWRRTPAGIVYTGPDRFALASRRDDANLAYRLTVPAAGTYRFRMRSRATSGGAEPPNDVWVRFGGVSWTKAFTPKPAQGFSEVTVGDRGGQQRADFLQSTLPAGPVTLTISGRSSGHEIDRVELFRVGGAAAAAVVVAPAAVAPAPAVAAPDPGMDLISLHYDSSPDWDDAQAMIANKLILERFPGRDFLVVNGTLGDEISRGAFIRGSTEHCRSIYGECLDYFADSGDAIERAAAAWAVTLRSGGRVFVAEGGPSDFTADVLLRLEGQGVPRSLLKRIDVVQHSSGRQFNELKTSDAGIAFVKSRATYVTIDNGNGDNRTPDFNQQGTSFEVRSLRSKYAAQWRTAYGFVKDARRVDFSDSVELMHILGLPKSHAPNVSAFADRYF